MKGISRTTGMRGRPKGGLASSEPDGFNRQDNFTLASEIDSWNEHLKQRNYSKQTIATHQTALKMFLEWSQQRDLAYPQHITRPILESYQRHLYRFKKPNGQPLSVATQRHRLGAIQRFFAHLCKNHILDANPASDLELPRKQHRQLPKGLSPAEINTILALPNISDPLGIRDRAILETLYATGARRSELVKLDLSDLDIDSKTLHIRQGKGGKSRIVPIGKNALYWLSHYLKVTRPKLLIDIGQQALFITGYGDRFNATYLGNWVAKTIKAAGIAKQGSCHLFRHSCATHMLENGADIRFIQQLLGHARLETTQIYTEVGINALREVYARTHPSAKNEFAKGDI